MSRSLSLIGRISQYSGKVHIVWVLWYCLRLPSVGLQDKVFRGKNYVELYYVTQICLFWNNTSCVISFCVDVFLLWSVTRHACVYFIIIWNFSIFESDLALLLYYPASTDVFTLASTFSSVNKEHLSWFFYATLSP